MKKLAIILALLILLAGGAVLFVLMFDNPRMKVQANLRTYEYVMPLPDPNAVPVEPVSALASEAEAESLRNPLRPTPENIARGKVYYQYYCIFCHGENGAAPGPVGESYNPQPPDLRTGRVKQMNDGQLLRAMLMGAGHEPVLSRNVPEDRRWYLVLYVHSLPGTGPAPAASPALPLERKEKP